MVSQAEVDRLRAEANAIVTRIERVDTALREAREREDDHWETGELVVTLDLETDAAENAQIRYERAKELGESLDRVRRVYAAMERVGLVTTYDGSIIKGTERKLKPKTETHRKHTYYVTTREAEQILRDRA